MLKNTWPYQRYNPRGFLSTELPSQGSASSMRSGSSSSCRVNHHARSSSSVCLYTPAALPFFPSEFPGNDWSVLPFDVHRFPSSLPNLAIHLPLLPFGNKSVLSDDLATWRPSCLPSKRPYSGEAGSFVGVRSSGCEPSHNGRDDARPAVRPCAQLGRGEVVALPSPRGIRR